MPFVHQQIVPGSGGAYSTKFYLGRLCSKVQSRVMCENAQYFTKRNFWKGCGDPVYMIVTTIYLTGKNYYLHISWSYFYPLHLLQQLSKEEAEERPC